MNKSIALLCIFLVAFTPTIVYAQEVPPVELTMGKISQLNKSQRAPFAGILLSNDTAAKLYGDIKFSKKECGLRLKKELDINTLQLTSHINALKLRLDIETKRTESLLSARNDRIKFLEKNWRPAPWYESGEFWFAMGIIAGIAVTVGSGYAIGQAAK